MPKYIVEKIYILIPAEYGVAAQGAVTISLYSGPVGHADSSVLASGTAIGNTNEWVDVFWGQTTLTIGHTYYLGLTSPANLQVAYGLNNYAGGSIYSNSVSYLASSYDLAFRTYADDGTGSTQVPEPVTGALMLAGLCALAFALRRRSASKPA